LKRADREKLSQIFKRYASVRLKPTDGGMIGGGDTEEESYMTANDFIRNYLGLFQSENYNEESVKLLAGIIDTSKDDLISFPEFQAFEGLLCLPDALYQIAFQLFDTKGTGLVTFDEFQGVIRHTEMFHKIPFDLDGGFVKLYFGKDKKRVVTYPEFSQFLHVSGFCLNS
jgi:solute carrier family 25 aspartate/glutamate transporter 12/13